MRGNIVNLENGNKLIANFEQVIHNPVKPQSESNLFTGIDLGTAYIVLAVVDELGTPIAGTYEFAQVVKDGLVVDYIKAVRIVKKLKDIIEEKIGMTLHLGATAYPPGTNHSDMRAINYVAEAAGFEIIHSIDEPTAANSVLGVKNGAVVDIGGGTTGTAIFQDGEVVYIDDEATGGTQFSLVIAGRYKIPFEEAEEIKKDPSRQDEFQPVIKPVMQKVAKIIQRHIGNYPVDTVYLVGGTSSNKYIDQVIGEELRLNIIKPINPFLVTPLGIAISAQLLFMENHTNDDT